MRERAGVGVCSASWHLWRGMPRDTTPHGAAVRVTRYEPDECREDSLLPASPASLLIASRHAPDMFVCAACARLPVIFPPRWCRLMLLGVERACLCASSRARRSHATSARRYEAWQRSRGRVARVAEACAPSGEARRLRPPGDLQQRRGQPCPMPQACSLHERMRRERLRASPPQATSALRHLRLCLPQPPRREAQRRGSAMRPPPEPSAQRRSPHASGCQQHMRQTRALICCAAT